MKHIKKALSYSVVGSLGLTVVASLQGCGDSGNQNQSGGDINVDQGYDQSQNQFIVIEQTGANPDTYKVIEQHPTSGETRAILRTLDGQERFMSEDELRQLAETEAKKVEDGTSRLTQDQAMQSGGLSLGETIMAAAVGSLIGGMIANKLAGNRNFQRNQRAAGGRPTSSISQPRKSTSSSSKPRSGFFGGSKNRSSGRSGFGGFGG